MTDLTDRMRTCAAALIQSDIVAAARVAASRAAADLLIEASNALEAIPEPLGEPMALIEAVAAIEPPPPDFKIDHKPSAVWTSGFDTLPPQTQSPPSPRPNRVCPQCDSHAVKKVYREGSLLMLACPVCSAGWEYQP